MRRAVTVLLACVACVGGMHCAAPTEDRAGAGASSPGEPGSDEASETAPPIVPHKGQRPDGHPIATAEALEGTIDGVLSSHGAHVLSFVKTEDGGMYATGTYEGSLEVGEDILHSRGEEDVFLLRVAGDGQVAWVRSVGSEGRETGPRVSVDALDPMRVRLLGVTHGEMNCGGGPMASWSGTATFFVCVFEGGTGASLEGGSFPVSP